MYFCLQLARFNYTCAGVRKAGERRSDVYYIDMDGMGPMPPVRALCDLGKTIETTVTQINNTKFKDIDVTTKSGTNEIDINYQASITQMRELIMNSDHCQQFIKYQCKGTPLFLSPSGPPMVRIFKLLLILLIKNLSFFGMKKFFNAAFTSPLTSPLTSLLFYSVVTIFKVPILPLLN